MLAGLIADFYLSIYEGSQSLNKEVDVFAGSMASVYPIIDKLDFVPKSPQLTDDSVCALALFEAYCLDLDPSEHLLKKALAYKNQVNGFGPSFTKWLSSNGQINPKSKGNGALMRIGFIPWLPLNLSQQLDLGQRYTNITHDHVVSLKAVDDYINLCYQLQNLPNKQTIAFDKGKPINGWLSENAKGLLKEYLLQNKADKSTSSWHDEKKFVMDCDLTLYMAISALIESVSFESFCQLVVYIGGDTDTMGVIGANLALNQTGIEVNLEHDCFKFMGQQMPWSRMQINTFVKMCHN